MPGSGTPHPRRDRGGHSFAQPDPRPEALDPSDPAASEAFRFALDLLNAGFCWEAHELLEGLWIAAGKAGAVAELLKALIKLCAAGVKSRQGMGGGVAKHVAAARRHFERAGTLAAAVRWEPDPERPGRGWAWLEEG